MALKRLEPCAGKLARTVLRRVVAGNSHGLSDNLPNIPTILDAGSLNSGTQALLSKVDYAVCSEKFARQLTGNIEDALQQISNVAPVAVITLGENGLIWKRGNEEGKLAALVINAVDTTGAGDAFHGAFAYGVASNMAWDKLLTFASVAGSLCCQKMGARRVRLKVWGNSITVMPRLNYSSILANHHWL